MVEVLVWNFMQNGNIGHAAAVVGGEYISWWPTETATLKSGRSAGAPNTLAEDLASEGRPPDHRIRITGLDDDAMVRWWRGFRHSNEYRLFVQNCSTVVGMALTRGGGRNRTSGLGWAWRSWNVVWTPDDVRRYAEAIVHG